MRKPPTDTPPASTTTSQTTIGVHHFGNAVTTQAPAPTGANQPVQMPEVTVIGQLDQARQQIVPSLGATVYTIDQQDIQDLTQGDNIPFSKLVLRFPGVSQDSAASGSFHVRDDHANVQYRINDVLIPESITSFGNQFDTRFADQRRSDHRSACRPNMASASRAFSISTPKAGRSIREATSTCTAAVMEPSTRASSTAVPRES